MAFRDLSHITEDKRKEFAKEWVKLNGLPVDQKRDKIKALANKAKCSPASFRVWAIKFGMIVPAKRASSKRVAAKK